MAVDKAANLPPTPTSFYPNPTGPWGYRCWMHLCPAQLSHHILHTQTVDVNSVGAQHPPIQLPKLSLPLHLSLPFCPILRLELFVFSRPQMKSLESGNRQHGLLITVRRCSRGRGSRGSRGNCAASLTMLNCSESVI